MADDWCTNFLTGSNVTAAVRNASGSNNSDGSMSLFSTSYQNGTKSVLQQSMPGPPQSTIATGSSMLSFHSRLAAKKPAALVPTMPTMQTIPAGDVAHHLQALRMQLGLTTHASVSAAMDLSTDGVLTNTGSSSGSDTITGFTGFGGALRRVSRAGASNGQHQPLSSLLTSAADSRLLVLDGPRAPQDSDPEENAGSRTRSVNGRSLRAQSGPKPRPCHECHMAQKSGQVLRTAHICAPSAPKPRKRTQSVVAKQSELDPSVRTYDMLSQFEQDFYRRVAQFYDGKDFIERYLLPLMIRPRKDKRMSIRLINWLASCYTLTDPVTNKKLDITYEVTWDGHLLETPAERAAWELTQDPDTRKEPERFDMESSYRDLLNRDTKELTDPFRRGPLFAHLLKDGSYFITTLGQLNFFSWAIRWLLLEYGRRHRDPIYAHMRKFQPARTPSASTAARRASKAAAVAAAVGTTTSSATSSGAIAASVPSLNVGDDVEEDDFDEYNGSTIVSANSSISSSLATGGSDAKRARTQSMPTVPTMSELPPRRRQSTRTPVSPSQVQTATSPSSPLRKPRRRKLTRPHAHGRFWILPTPVIGGPAFPMPVSAEDNAVPAADSTVRV